MIQIFYGDGKGKTSILNGMALRASGANLKVVVFRFLKGIKCSEDEQLEKLGIKTKSLHFGTKFVFQMNEEEFENTSKVILEGLNEISKIAKDFDVIVLDEILDLCAKNVNIISEEFLTHFIQSLDCKEILISGHTYVKELFEISDLITKLSSEKHYYNKNTHARKGFEY